VYARIIMTPQHVKSLEKVLSDNIQRYESKHGKINLQGQEDRNIGFQPGSGAEE
jgi:hypothetical protein